jgi:hypothetical protein
MNATTFGRNSPFGAKLNAIFSSDIGHFDVIDMCDPLPEAYELVEDRHITEDDFRDFTFANAVRLWGRRTRNSSRARASPNKPPRSSPRPRRRLPQNRRSCQTARKSTVPRRCRAAFSVSLEMESRGRPLGDALISEQTHPIPQTTFARILFFSIPSIISQY